MTFEAHLYDCGYFEGLHKSHWFTNPPRKYDERNRDTKARDFIPRQFPQHIAIRHVGAYRRFLADAGLVIDLDTWSVSPFPGMRFLERVLAPLPFFGETFRYRILMQAVRP